jgi:hypothetical protein
MQSKKLDHRAIRHRSVVHERPCLADEVQAGATGTSLVSDVNPIIERALNEYDSTA